MASAHGIAQDPVPVIDRAHLDRLIALGRARGELGPDDLRAVLPIDAMRVEDVVLVILELEEAGVSVEPDAFGPARSEPAARLPPRPARTPSAIEQPHAAADDANPATVMPPTTGRAASTPRTDSPEEAARVHRAVALAGAATLLILAAVLLLT